MSSQSSLLLRVSQVPDWERRAIRLSLALIFFTSLGLTLWPVPESYRAEWGDEVVQSCNWAGATCAVVAASPLIGKVAQLSYERTLGTMTGGMLGFLVYDYGVLLLPPVASQVLMVVCAAAVGFLSCWLSFKFKLDASMRLFVITFLIVTFGAHNADSRSALGVALLRTGGIISGVLLFMTLTIIILPKSATIESLREMKAGLKLLTELNTLVWTSRREAAAAMKQAAAAARTAEAAVAEAAATNQQQQQQQPGGVGSTSSGSGRSRSMWQSLGLSRNSRSATAAAAAAAANPHGYLPLPDADPESGLLPAAAAAAQGAAAAPTQADSTATVAPHNGSSSSSSRVSQLTQALQKSSSKHNTANHTFAAAVGSIRFGGSKPQQQQQQGIMPSYESVLEQYEQKCEEVLTSVYQSMFKVKDHINLADSEIYIFHFWGHYFFMPIFFNHRLVNWLLPSRWKLPKQAMEELSTSVRVIARLLWTVHMDYSQGFDEVLSALPATANMSNLLEELGQLTSAALGVLVEAFPNKDAIVVDSLNRLDKLVDSMLALSAAQHQTLFHDLAANRQPVRLNMSASTAPQPPTPPAAAAAAVPISLPVSTGPAAGPQHAWQQQQQQTPPRQVAFITLEDNSHGVTDSSVVDSLAFDGFGPPIRTESPQIGSPVGPASPHKRTAAASSNAAPPQAAAVAADDQQADLMFPLSDTEVVGTATATAAAAAGAGQGSSPSLQGFTSSSPVGQQGLASTPSGFNRLVSLHSRAQNPSLVGKSRFKPYAVMAAVKLHAAAQHGSARSIARAAEAVTGMSAAAAAGGSGSSSTAQHWGVGADVVAPTSRDLIRNLSTVSAPDPSVAQSAAAALQKQGVLSPFVENAPPPAAAAAGSPSVAVTAVPGEKLEAQESVADMSFVKVMRWYSFQILMDELLAEMDELYCCVREVVQRLPHGL